MTRNEYKAGLFEVDDMLSKAARRLDELRDELEEDRSRTFSKQQRTYLLEMCTDITTAKNKIEQAQSDMRENQR